MYAKLIIKVPTPNVQRSHSHLHLPHQRAALGLVGVAPGSASHAGVRADDGELAQGNAVVEERHPVVVDICARVIAVLCIEEGEEKDQHYIVNHLK